MKMKVLMLYNQQRSTHGGEETVVNRTVKLLRAHGVEVAYAQKSSRGSNASIIRKVAAGIGGAYNFSSYKEVKRLIRTIRPDVVHAHNIFPNWSPAVFAASRSCGVPSIYSVHSQILTCPTWYHLRSGSICERCLGGREHRCVLSNCRGSLPESVAYAARSIVIRIGGLVRNAATLLIAMSEFQKAQLIRGGYPSEQIVVIPNVVDVPDTPIDPSAGRYIAFVGRLSEEKGLNVLLEVARRMSGVPFRIAGDGPLREFILRNAPPNVEWVGLLDRSEMDGFYRSARIVVVPSLSYETFCLVAAESLAYGVPVVASAVGALPEILNGNVNGIQFPPGDIESCVAAIDTLLRDPARCGRIGQQGRSFVADRFSANQHFSSLCTAYAQAGQMLARVRRER